MNFLSPLARQLVVASSPQLAALSVGGLNAFPAVLLNQLQRNNSSILLDVDSASWVASIHGLAGIPSLLIPSLMQWKGRRFAYITTCLCILIGWILIYSATNITTILLGECIHGFGGRSLNAVSLVAISEMLDPRFRSTSMVIFGILEMIGLVIVTFAGYFLHWRTVSIVLATPALIALLLVIFWPESPSWLACKGEFGKCEIAFILLRGTGKEATKELTELLRAQKESLRQISLEKSLNKSVIKDVWCTLQRKDFFTPFICVVIIMFTFYFSGPLVVFTYSVEIIANTTKNSDFICFIYIDVIVIVGSIVGILLLRKFNNKPVLNFSLFGSGFFLVLSSIVIYFKDSTIIPKQAILICILGNLFCCVFGSCYLTFNISAELIPVKHRGLGGSWYIVIACLFHSGSLKISPYLFKVIGMSGTFIIFAVVSFTGLLLIWKFVPETKGKTLQQIEDFYNIGTLKMSEDCETSKINDGVVE